MQTPLLQVRPVPQDVPSAAKVLSVQTGTPDVQLIAAVRAHGFVDVHTVP